MISDKIGYYVTIEYDIASHSNQMGFDCLFCFDYDYMIQLLRDCIYLGRSIRTGTTPNCKILKAINKNNKDITEEVKIAVRMRKE